MITRKAKHEFFLRCCGVFVVGYRRRAACSPFLISFPDSRSELPMYGLDFFICNRFCAQQSLYY